MGMRQYKTTLNRHRSPKKLQSELTILGPKMLRVVLGDPYAQDT